MGVQGRGSAGAAEQQRGRGHGCIERFALAAARGARALDPPPLSLPHEPRVPRQSEDELREFIHQTVELASTLLEQTAALKKKAGGGKSFSPYV